jgi:hypothetical protein
MDECKLQNRFAGSIPRMIGMPGATGGRVFLAIDAETLCTRVRICVGVTIFFTVRGRETSAPRVTDPAARIR